MSKKSNRFPPEVRERAVRMVQEHRGAYHIKAPSVHFTCVVYENSTLSVPPVTAIRAYVAVP